MTELEKDILLEHISNLISQGYVAGIDPNWQLVLSDISFSEVSEGTIFHISKQIKNWIMSGEIQEDSKQGWWHLSISDSTPDWQFMEDYIKSLPYTDNI